MALLPFKKRMSVRSYAVDSAHKSVTKPVEEISKKPREVLDSELPIKKRVIVGERKNSLGEHNDEKMRLKKPKIMKEEAVVDQEGLNPPPESDLPVQFKDRIRAMNGTEPKLVIQKPLTESDLKRHCTRFAIPRGILKTTNFLTKEEHDIVDKIKGGSIEVILLDPALREFKLNFIRWQMSTSFTYNLTLGWTEVLKINNDLKQYDWVQLWCFQRDFNSCLALVHLPHGWRDGEGTQSGCSGNTA